MGPSTTLIEVGHKHKGVVMQMLVPRIGLSRFRCLPFPPKPSLSFCYESLRLGSADFRGTASPEPCRRIVLALNRLYVFCPASTKVKVYSTKSELRARPPAGLTYVLGSRLAWPTTCVPLVAWPPMSRTQMQAYGNSL
ncbi:hypothetical protein HC256_000197 [Beauveria bassiana]|nr:hypothetical protein HC256_000197 [Beauveria bassiana]